MIATAFEYTAPTDLDALHDAVADGEATILGGGTWVVPEMSSGLRAPCRVVDLRRLGLDGLATDGGDLMVGAMTTYRRLLREAATHGPAGALLLAMASGITGGPQLRNVGTVGGSACYATPASEVPAVLVALDARLRVTGPRGARVLAAGEFFIDAFRCALEPDEVLVGIDVPALAPSTQVGYRKLKLSESSYPIATAACLVDRADDGTVRAVRLVVGAACAVPKPIPVDDLVVGRAAPEDLEAIVERARGECEQAHADVLADAAYRHEVSGVVAKRALVMALEAA